jgi:hypothetical protein
VAAWLAPHAAAEGVFVRARVLQPTGAGEKHTITTGGFRHDGPAQWYLPTKSLAVAGDQWSEWIDAGGFGLHGRLRRAGGIAEWPAMKLTVAGTAAAAGVKLQVQLADRPDPSATVIDFTESAGGNTIAFLLVHPLREKKEEFETGSQMTARQLRWAREVSGGKRPDVGRFRILTSVWGHYDPALARQATETLGLLGVNVMGGVPVNVLRDNAMQTYAATWHLAPDPDAGREQWRKGEQAAIERSLATPDGRWTYENMAHFVVADEIQTLDMRQTDPAKIDGWFRQYLRDRGETDATLGTPIDAANWQGKLLYERSLPREADLPTRRLAYHSGRFAQWWSVRQLRQTSDLVRETFAAAKPPIAMQTETLPADHAFFGAWEPPKLGMGALNLDLFEIGRQQAVDIVSAEDWMGLNHMYGPKYTWLGGQGFGYLTAVLRGGIRERSVALRGLITPSDDRYLRLKAYSTIGQGSKSIFYWTFGPTYIGTENYWSDLRSMYDGIAKTSRALEQAEPVLFPARTVNDPVAILASVSHDLWHTDDPAVFVETRLAYAALRHLSIQPDVLGEEEIEAGCLDRHKVLYLAGNCLRRKTAAAIDAWVRKGGVLHLSAGAATRDEFYEPHVPAFAAAVYPADAATALVKEKGHRYNERFDLPTIKPLATAHLQLDGRTVQRPAIGYRQDLSGRTGDGLQVTGTFADGKPAAMRARHGAGLVLAHGFLPGLAASPFTVGQTSLDERWDPDGRLVFAAALQAADIRPVVAASEPVVEANLLTGPRGSAIVLVNYTYQPIKKLSLRISRDLGHAVTGATSTEGVPVELRRDEAGIVLDLPLDWTDIVLLPAP